MVLSAFLFMRRMAEVSNVTVIRRELADGANGEDDEEAAALARQLPKGVVVYEVNGPLFFGAAERFRSVLGEISDKPRVLVVRMRHVPATDSTGIQALRELVHNSIRGGTRVILAEVADQPMTVLTNAGLLDELGPGNVFATLDEALERATDTRAGAAS